MVKDQTFYVFFFRTPSLMMRITLGRSIGGLNCDIGGFRDTNVRNIFKRFLHAGIVLYFLHNADQTFKLHFRTGPSAGTGVCRSDITPQEVQLLGHKFHPGFDPGEANRAWNKTSQTGRKVCDVSE